MVFGLTSLVAVAGGFLVAQAVGGDSDESSLGSLPSTVSVESSDSRVPNFTPHGELPPLEVTTVAPEATSKEGSGVEVESEYEPEPTYSPPSEEKSPYVPPSTTPTAAPEVTVGKNE
jgi:hypothetical protein